MGYATTLYAVNLDALRAAVGSGDARLLRRLRPAKKSAKKRDPMQGPRVKLTRKGEIILNGQPVSFDGLKAELNRRKWKGTYLFSYVEGTPRTGRWRKPGSFPLALAKAYPHTQFLGTLVCDSDEDLARGWEDEEVSQEEAAAELVEGTVSQPGAAHQYGYALERLCQLLGTRLATIEGKRGMLRALKLNTPLSRDRSPVRLPKRDDFPGIGYLTADELEREVERLRGLDLSYPASPEIEEDRRTFLRCLQKAAKRRAGVVSFYY
jgi:hypothetical protein